MGSLLLFLLLGCVLSLVAMSCQATAMWSRLPLACLLLGIYGLNLAGRINSLTPVFLVASALLGCALLRWGDSSIERLKFYFFPIAAAFLLAFFVGFRPALLEYPVDHIDYWQRLVEGSGVGNAVAVACDMGGLATYTSQCTLWHKAAAAWPAAHSFVVSGLFARLAHCGELLLLALTLIRLWMSQSIRPVAAVCMLVLVFAGTGYLYDAFVINHALQGSILAAALLVESAGVFCSLFGEFRRSRSKSQAFRLIAAWYCIGVVYLLLAIKLHGLFALLTLIWILVVPVVLAVLPGPVWSQPGRPVVWMFAAAALASTSCLFVVKNAVNLVITPNYAGVAIRWSDRLGLEGFGDWGPVSFIPRTSDTRPEALAVLGLMGSLIILAALLDRRSADLFNPLLLTDRQPEELRAADSGFGVAADYAIVSSAYVVSILLVYLLPPFSNLFLKLNPQYSSHMRLMWGACLVSPLPCLLFFPRVRLRRIIAAISIAAMAVILVPVQVVSGQRAQVFFSKSRHFLVPTPAWSDPSHVASVIIPRLRRIAGSEANLRALHVVADPVIRSALYPFGIQGDPPMALGADRLFQPSTLPPGFVRPALHVAPLRASLGQASALPGIVIQQDPRDCFYSVYSDMQAYAPCMAAYAAGFDVNRWSPDALRRLGYFLAWRSKSDGYRIWRLSAS